MLEDIVSFWGFLEAFIGGGSLDPDKPIFGSHVPAYMEK
jgi:hypothetical protein